MTGIITVTGSLGCRQKKPNLAEKSEGESSDSPNSSIVVSSKDFESSISLEKGVIEDKEGMEKARVVSHPSCIKRKSSQP